MRNKLKQELAKTTEETQILEKNVKNIIECNPIEWYEELKENMKREYKVAFLSAFIIGLLIHMPAFIFDIPNHDGLASMYFDQNMITSGRWFLTIACGISSYFTIPWFIGIISLIWISITCALLIGIFEIKQPIHIIILSGLFVAFPSLASTYAYIFTADGYLMGLFLAVLAVYLTKKYKGKGFIAGGICLAFSLGIYQAYLSFAMLLSLYILCTCYIKSDDTKEKRTFTFKVIGMGAIGASLYYIILQILLKIEGVSLADYQGINEMGSFKGGILDIVKHMYIDFAAFVVNSKVMYSNMIGLVFGVILILLSVLALISLIRDYELYRKPFFYLVVILLVTLIPICSNVILIVSPDVNYHLLMRYQYVLFVMACFVILMRKSEDYFEVDGLKKIAQWLVVLIGIAFVINYTVTDNIAYSNLEKKYEKTYAYCLRLADRIEQTPGYYTGMPVVMIGVVGDWNYPKTELTGKVTDNMIGFAGDYICYKPEDYKSFFANYLGITIEVMDQDTIGDIYLNDKTYYELDSFPGEHCTEVVDGVLYVKTENALKITGEKPQ